MVSVRTASRNITSASCYHPRYQSRSSMYIIGLIPWNFAELAEAVPIAMLPHMGLHCSLLQTCGILGQVWYLIVLFPDLCRLSNSSYENSNNEKERILYYCKQNGRFYSALIGQDNFFYDKLVKSACA